MGCGKARFSREGQKNRPKLKILVSKFAPWDLEATRTWDLEATCNETSRQPAIGPRGDPQRPRGNPQWDLEANRTDLEATRNDRKQAILQPRKQTRISLHKLLLLCFLGYGIACLEVCAGCLEVQSWVASTSVRVDSRSHRGLPRGFMSGSPRGPREQTLRPKFSIFGVFLVLPTETSFTTLHSIQNMRFGR